MTVPEQLVPALGKAAGAIAPKGQPLAYWRAQAADHEFELLNP